jgi:hypothetical protein
MIPRARDIPALNAEDLIQLPRFDAGGAIAVGDLLLVEIEEPATSALAMALLEPLLSWKSSTLGRNAGEMTIY